MTIFVPFGGLVSFGNINFTGPSTPVQDFTLQWVQAYIKLANKDYVQDMYGTSDAPLDEPEASWVYMVRAAYGQTPAASYTDVETQFNNILAALRTPYTPAGFTAPVSGNVGYLSVHKANNTTVVKAWARIKSLELKLLPARNTYAYLLPLSFKILGDFS